MNSCPPTILGSWKLDTDRLSKSSFQKNYFNWLINSGGSIFLCENK